MSLPGAAWPLRPRPRAAASFKHESAQFNTGAPCPIEAPRRSSHTHKCTEYKPAGIPPRTKIAKPAHATRQQRKARCYSTTRNLTVVPTQKWTRCVLTTATTLRILPSTMATAPTRVGPGAGPVNWTAERGQNAGPSSRARSPRAGGAARCGCLAGDDQSASLERHGVFCDNPFFLLASAQPSGATSASAPRRH